MDYQSKIDSMQKYLPFLSKLIKKLQQEPENAAKVVQMQLLYDMLDSPQPSVTIEELNECENALEALYKISGASTAEDVALSPKNVSSASPSEISKEPEVTQVEEESTAKSNKDDETEKIICKQNGTNEIVKERNDEEIKGVVQEKTTENSEEEKNTENSIEEEEDNQTEKSKNNKETSEHDTIETTECKLIDKAEIDNNKDTNCDDTLTKSSESDNDDEKIETTADTETQQSIDNEVEEDEDIEENVELIKFPEEEDADEMILPDSGDEEQETGDKSSEDEKDDEQEDEKEVERDDEKEEGQDDENEDDPKNMVKVSENENKTNEINNDTDNDETTITSTTSQCADAELAPEEPELVAIEAENSNLDEGEKSDDSYDPLNCEDTTGKSKNQNTQKDTENAEFIEKTNKIADDDDDDVQLIETRNSPICIDSDDEESVVPAKVTPSSSPLLQPIQSRPFARKSTAKPSKSVPHIQKKPKNLSYLQQANKPRPQRRRVVDTIDLLDSSDDEPSKDHRNSKTKSTMGNSPAKRRLLTNLKVNNNKKHRTALPKTSMPLPAQFTQAKQKAVARPIYVPTPQSSFLNAVNLQPANASKNPPAFSAQLFNKNVIIPNAFYGNPPEVRSPVATPQRGRPRLAPKQIEPVGTMEEQQLERSYRRWLENFLTHFASPQQIASHTCFVLLQRVLKYKLFMRVKEMRTNLNTLAQEAKQAVDIQLMLDLRNVFYKSSKQLSEVGRRFCELGCTHVQGKAVTLTMDALSKRVTSRTRTVEEMSLERSSNVSRERETPMTPNFSGIFKTSSTISPIMTQSGARKRERDDVEYTPPNKVVSLPSFEGESSGERKKSLRAKRTRRIDNSFTYNEDQDDFDDDDDDVDESYAAVQRKVERKRLEAKRQREQQAKSFENAFIDTFTKSLGENVKKDVPISKMQRKQGSNQLAPSCNETLIIPDDDDDDDGSYEPRQHRIYKVIPAKLTAAVRSSSSGTPQQKGLRGRPPKIKVPTPPPVEIIENPEVITCDDIDTDTNESQDDLITIDHNSIDIDPAKAPKNIDRSMHSMHKDHEWCNLCNRRASRIVHHYVNEHRGCEVYTSRLTDTQVTQLQPHRVIISEMSLYKNGQQQYEATCVFCQKQSRFMLPYWHQHYAMHTGEYAYRCSGCGVRKPTRSLLAAHTNQPCPRRGVVRQDYTFDSKATQIEAYVCILCNYVQLHRKNVVKHLHTQHNVRNLLPKHIQNVVLLKTRVDGSSSNSPMASTSTKIKRSMTVRSNDAVFEIADVDDSVSGSGSGSWPCGVAGDDAGNDGALSHVGQWDDGDPCDDLSFMICGMLDVQMNTE